MSIEKRDREPVTSKLLIYDSAGKILILHEKDVANLVGGRIKTKRGESPLACAIRERDEEIGPNMSYVEPEPLHIFTKRITDTKGTQRTIHYFAQRTTTPTDIERNHESTGYSWVSPNSLNDGYFDRSGFKKSTSLRAIAGKIPTLKDYLELRTSKTHP